MGIKKITDEEIQNSQIQGNLPNRPTQKSLYPDNTMTAEEVKAVFDKLPKLLVERYNELVGAITDATTEDLNGDNLASLMHTGIRDKHTLNDLFRELKRGEWDAKDGKDGKSVSIISIAGSTESGGENLITIDDGGVIKTLSIRNGYDGKDGKNGIDGKDGKSVSIVSITGSTESGDECLVTFDDGGVIKTMSIRNGYDGKDGKNGIDGTNGKDGISGVHVGTSTPPEGTTVWIETSGEYGHTEEWEFTDENGNIHTKNIIIPPNKALVGLRIKQPDGSWQEIPALIGRQGENGKSVSIVSIAGSTESGGENLVTFNDGGEIKTMSIRNGYDGKDGKNGIDGKNGNDGKSVSIVSITGGTESGDECLVTFNDGGEIKTMSVRNGYDGKDGKDYVLTTTDKTEIAETVKNTLTTETWKFSLEDGSVVTKAVHVG